MYFYNITRYVIFVETKIVTTILVCVCFRVCFKGPCFSLQFLFSFIFLYLPLTGLLLVIYLRRLVCFISLSSYVHMRAHTHTHETQCCRPFTRHAVSALTDQIRTVYLLWYLFFLSVSQFLFLSLYCLCPRLSCFFPFYEFFPFSFLEVPLPFSILSFFSLSVTASLSSCRNVPGFE